MLIERSLSEHSLRTGAFLRSSCEKEDNRFYLESYSIPLSIESASDLAIAIGDFVIAVEILGFELIAPPIVICEQRHIGGTILKRGYILVTRRRPLMKRM
jgi:hypothetical protein